MEKKHITSGQSTFRRSLRSLPPIVLSWYSWNCPFTKRSTRLDLPTADSPRRTSLNWQILFCVVPFAFARWPGARFAIFHSRPDFQSIIWRLRMIFGESVTLFALLKNVAFYHLSRLHAGYSLHKMKDRAKPGYGQQFNTFWIFGGVPIFLIKFFFKVTKLKLWN